MLLKRPGARSITEAAPRRWPPRLLAAVGAGAIALVSSGTQGEPLHETMSWALRSSFDVKADDERQAAADATVTAAWEAFLPTVTYNFNRILDSSVTYSPDYTALPDAPVGIDTVPRREPDLDSFQVSLPLFDGFKRSNDLRAAQKFAAAGRELQDDKRQQILLQTASAYLAVLRDRSILALRQEAMADVTAVARSVAARYAVRDATQADAALAESRIAAARAAIEQATADLATSGIELTRLAGPASTPSMRPAVPDALLPRSTAELQSLLHQANPKLAASRLSAESAGFTADAAYARFAPQLNLLFSNTNEGALSRYRYKTYDTTTLLQLRLPLYDPGSFSNVVGQRAVAQQRRFESLDLERTVAAEATSAFTQRQALIAEISEAKSRVAKLDHAVRAQRVAQSIGSLTIVDVLNTVAELADARIALVNLEFSRDKATYSLVASLNRLTE